MASMAASTALLVGAGRPARNRRRAGWAALAAVVLVALSLSGWEVFANMHRVDPQSPVSNRARSTASPTPTKTSPPAAARRLAPVKAVAFGPGGASDGDDPTLADSALSTGAGWHSAWYATAAFGNLQDGTGLLVDMGAAVSITSVSAELGLQPGATVELEVGDTPVKAAMHTVKHVTNASRQVVLQFPAVKARYFLIWYTQLPPDGSGTYQANVAGIVVRGHR
jgi:hypothetical protein